RRRETQV
nr:Chain C, peptide E6 [synthetic construct]2I04_D Chain D, peptide E6 [synthetic construct]2I0I_D Chain D, peptide E6 [synthetic construct]2I0I_E Chain E, peptide E6 [synthetic construct]2I0I_F Chain F, peptide E6 [synthetic construct]2I0L_C Chain C, peptide E6 [synthetic construct]2I0L_D Chain D, peptide E6 [synthetic construct]